MVVHVLHNHIPELAGRLPKNSGEDPDPVPFRAEVDDAKNILGMKIKNLGPKRRCLLSQKKRFELERKLKA